MGKGTFRRGRGLDFPIDDDTETTRRACRRQRVVRGAKGRTRKDRMLSWKSIRQPRRVHFSYQANIATFQFRNILVLKTTTRARVVALDAAPMDGDVKIACAIGNPIGKGYGPA